MNAKIQRLPNGEVLGAVLWIPAFVIGNKIKIGQEEIELSFEEKKTKERDELNIFTELPIEYIPRVIIPLDFDALRKSFIEIDANEANEIRLHDETANMVAPPVAHSVASEHELRILNYIKKYSYCRLMDIHRNTNLNNGTVFLY